MKNILNKISFNSPIILVFAAICVLTFFINHVTGGFSNNILFSVYRAPLSQPLTYLRFIGHIFGHANWQHLSANMTMFLLIGPLLEEKYGSQNIIAVIIVTAVVTGIVNFVFFPNAALLGSSGVVFAFIILSSFTGVKSGKIPLTFILVLVIYISAQIYDGIFVNDNVSNITHIVGGIIGGIFGFVINGKFRNI